MYNVCVHHSKQFVNTGIGEKKVRDKIIISCALL